MWIKCSDKLPPANKPVLVTDGEIISVAFRYDNFINKSCLWVDANCDVWSYGKITHWQELPALP